MIQGKDIYLFILFNNLLNISSFASKFDHIQNKVILGVVGKN